MKKTILLAGLVFGLNTAFAQLPSNVPTGGLVGYWPFDNNSANDFSGNNYHGTNNGAVPTTDRYNIVNHAFDFNGTSDYIIVPSATGLSGFSNLSISVWVKTNALTNVQAIVAKWYQVLNCGPTNNSDTYEVALAGPSVQFATNFNNTTGVSGPPQFNSGDIRIWRHLVFVFNSGAGTMSIYIDGTQAHSSSTAGTNICSTANDLFFGADWNGHTSSLWRYFDGGIDDIGIWDAVLTPCEILALYAPPGRDTDDGGGGGDGDPKDRVAFTPTKSIKNSTSMKQNEPNPFINETVIEYNLTDDVKNASLIVYDLSGRQVASFPLHAKRIFFYFNEFEKLKAGVYIYSIYADGKK